MKKLIFFISLLFFWPILSQAATPFNLRIKLIDELGVPLSGTLPTITVSDCLDPRIEAIRFLGDGVYELAIATSPLDGTCAISVTSSAYLHTSPVATGNLQAGVLSDKTSSPIVLTYRTKVTVNDAAGAPLTSAVIHHGGFSPAAQSGNNYYFTTSAALPLILELPGYVTEDGSQRNRALRSTSGGSNNSQTLVEFGGQNLCSESSVASGARVNCAAPLPSTTVAVKDEAASGIAGATVRIYKDLGKTEFAANLTQAGLSAVGDTDAAGMINFALTPAVYYYRAERFGRNDAVGSFEVKLGFQKIVNLKLTAAGANVISPARSSVLVWDQEAPADNASVARVTATVKDGNGTTLGRGIKVILTSNRPLDDKIDPATGYTDSDGRITFSVTSAAAGKSTFSLEAGGVALTTFPSINFTIPAAALADKTVSKIKSKINASASPLSADGKDVADITVTIKNAVDVVLKDKTVLLSSSRGGAIDTIAPTLATTDADGQAAFNIKSSTPGTAILTATADGIKLADEVAVTFTPLALLENVVSGGLIKLPDDRDSKTTADQAVYYYGSNGKRYVFPNSATYFTWYADFSAVKEVPAETLAAISIGGNVTYKPGARLVKIQTDPKVYAVGKGGALRWVKTEALAKSLYGDNWAKSVQDVPDAFFSDYKRGADIESAADFSPAAEQTAATGIATDKGL